MFDLKAGATRAQPVVTARNKTIRAANNNGDRRITVRLSPVRTISIAEIEVFGALLAELEITAANDNVRDTPSER